MGAFGRNIPAPSSGAENQRPRVLMRSRRAASATSSGLPTTVPAGGVVAFTITFSQLIATAAGVAVLPQNTRVRVGMLGATLTTDAGGAPFLQLQSAQLQTASGAIAAPLSSGSPLGLANGATLGGVMEFDSNDLQYLSTQVAANVSLVLQIKNSDSSDHQVTAFAASVYVETEQLDKPMQGNP